MPVSRIPSGWVTDSTWMTSAPRAASVWVDDGPAHQLADGAVLANIGGGGGIHARHAWRRECAGAAKEFGDRGGGVLIGGGMAEHERTAADLAGNQPAFAHQRIGPADRADGDADVEGEIALRRQLGAGGQGAGGDVVLDPVGKAHIKRCGAVIERGEPICHGVKFSIVIPNESIQESASGGF